LKYHQPLIVFIHVVVKARNGWNMRKCAVDSLLFEVSLLYPGKPVIKLGLLEIALV
jgi:hypothetical protein